MSTRPDEFLLQVWKQQLDAGLRIIETVIEGAEKLREAQLQAAADAHADAEATRKAIAAASDPAEILRLQGEWMSASVRKCMAYWRSLYEVVAETDGEVAGCACGAALPLSGQDVAVLGPDASKQALFNLIDNAYRQWLGATQQFYKLPAIPAQVEKRAEERAAV